MDTSTLCTFLEVSQAQTYPRLSPECQRVTWQPASLDLFLRLTGTLKTRRSFAKALMSISGGFVSKPPQESGS